MGLYEHLPYTNIHNLNEDWILTEVKKALGEWAATKLEWAGTKAEWEALYRYVHDYFDNLDVSQEISDKLEQMLSSGELDPLITAVLTGAVGDIQQQLDVLRARMDTFVNLPEGSTTGDAELADIRVDFKGIAWDVAGNAVRGADQSIADATVWNNDNEATRVFVSLENGTINSQGEPSETNLRYRVRTVDFIPTAGIKGIKVDRNTRAWVSNLFYYNEQQELVTEVQNRGSGAANITIDQQYPYFKIVLIDYTGESWFNPISPGMSALEHVFYKEYPLATRVNNNNINIHAQAYTSSGVFTYQRSGNTVRLDFGGGSLIVRNKSNGSTSFSTAVIQELALAAGWSVDGSAIVAPTPSAGLYLWIDTNELAFSTPSGVTKHTINNRLITLFENHYASIYTGLLVTWAYGNQIAEIVPYVNRVFKAQAYISGGAPFRYRRAGNNVILDTGGHSILVRWVNNTTATTISWQDIQDACAAAGWSVSQEEGSTEFIAPAASCGMYFNIADSSLVLRTGNPVHSNNPDYVILFENHYGSYYGGLLVDYSLVMTKENADESVPDYYRSHMKSKLETISRNMEEVGIDGETFIWITDLHWSNNRRSSAALYKWLLDHSNINYAMCGGDLIGEGLYDEQAKIMRDCITAFQHRNVYMPCVFGNHDSNWNNYQDQQQHPERKFSKAAQYALMQKQAENLVTYWTDPAAGWNWYFDIPQTKTRMIGLDTGMGVGKEGDFSSFQALHDQLMTTPDGYNIIMAAHLIAHYDSGTETWDFNATGAKIAAMMDALNARSTCTISGVTYDFTGARGVIRLMMIGHSHYDMSMTTPGGIRVIMTDSDNGPRSNSGNYQAGTVNEQAFDVVTVNYTTGAIKTVRIGRGSDRSF